MDTCSPTSHSKIMGINMELVSPLLLQQLQLFWEGFPRDVGTLLWGFASIQPRALVRSGTDVGRLGLARSLHFNSSQRCSMGLRSGLCTCQSSYSTPIWTNHFCMTLLCARGIVMLKQERAFPKLLPQRWKHRIIWNVIVCCSVEIYLHGSSRAQPEP